MELRINIANRIIGLNIGKEYPVDFLKRVHQQYELFLSEKQPEILVDVELTDSAPPKYLPNPYVTFKDGLITIKDDCLEGSLDWNKRRGRLKLNPVNPLYPLGTFLRNICTFLAVLEDKGIALHAVGILKDDEAYVFIGPSGAGKSTVARLSCGKTVLSDDLLLLKKVDGEFKVFPVPNWGDKQLGRRQNKPYPINSMYKLIKDKQVYLEKFSSACALADIFTIPHVPVEYIPADGLLGTFAGLINCIPYYGLHFLPEPSFWNCIEELNYANTRKNTCKV